MDRGRAVSHLVFEKRKVCVMHKKDALRLRPGDHILFGPSARVAECIGLTEEGEVQHVTENGGIKVCVMYGHGPRRTYGEPKWIPYHHVISVTYRAPGEPDDADEGDILQRKWSDICPR
jgi:hypothetical protein